MDSIGWEGKEADISQTQYVTSLSLPLTFFSSYVSSQLSKASRKNSTQKYWKSGKLLSRKVF